MSAGNIIKHYNILHGGTKVAEVHPLISGSRLAVLVCSQFEHMDLREAGQSSVSSPWINNVLTSSCCSVSPHSCNKPLLAGRPQSQLDP